MELSDLENNSKKEFSQNHRTFCRYEDFQKFRNAYYSDTIDSNNLKNFQDSQNCDSFSPNKTIFKTPMGSSGHLVGIFPIVLSEFETNIFCELRYKYPIKSISSCQNKIVIKKCTFIEKNTKLVIDGFIEKTVTNSL